MENPPFLRKRGIFCGEPPRASSCLLGLLDGSRVKPPDRSPGSAGSQFVLAGRWSNQTIGSSRLFAGSRSAYRYEQIVWEIPRFSGIGGLFSIVGNGHDRSAVQCGITAAPPAKRETRLPCAKHGGAVSLLTEGVCGMTCCNKSLPAQRDQPPSPSVIANQCAHWCGNPHLSGPSGAGRRAAPQGLRIATGLRPSQ